MPRPAPELHERKYIIIPIAAHHLQLHFNRSLVSHSTLPVSVGILVALGLLNCLVAILPLLFGQTPPGFASPPSGFRKLARTGRKQCSLMDSAFSSS